VWVDNAGAIYILRAAGVDYALGFYLHRP
jgi:hypothetical protein